MYPIGCFEILSAFLQVLTYENVKEIGKYLRCDAVPFVWIDTSVWKESVASVFRAEVLQQIPA